MRALFPFGRENFYPRPLRGGRRRNAESLPGDCKISIHALCEEGDRWGIGGELLRAISIHALCEEGDVTT